jgi:hypothetical protein
MLQVTDEAASIGGSYTEQYGWIARRFDDVILWDFYFNGVLPYRIRYCDCILYRHVRQILRSNREPVVGPRSRAHRKVELRHQPVGPRG